MWRYRRKYRHFRRCGVVVRRWSHAREADVVIEVGITYDRYTQGEVVVASTYHYADGGVRIGASHRVAVAEGVQEVVLQIWDMLFEEVVRVQQELPNSVALRLDAVEADGWRPEIATLLRIVGYELRVPVEA
jgi:hypothetical protein